MEAPTKYPHFQTIKPSSPLSFTKLLQMETPTQYPGALPSESDFLRRYHDAPLSLMGPGPIHPVSPGVRAWMERTYEARVSGQVRGMHLLSWCFKHVHMLSLVEYWCTA